MCFLFPLLTAAQDIEVKGTVLSGEDDLLLPGASVLITGTTTSTSTDIDGNFTVTNVPALGQLSISFMGCQSHTTALGNYYY